MRSFSVEGKEISVWPADGDNRPVIYLNTFAAEGEKVYNQMQKDGAPDFSLVAVSKLDWDHDMAPWDSPPLSRMDTPCSGGADDFLKLLEEEIVPEAEKDLRGEPAWRGITGYSLAGLFAVYAPYKSDLFSRVASMSGSLWFPNIKEYIFGHEFVRQPDAVYLSLGNKESRTRNEFLKTTEGNTDEIQKFYAKKGIDSVFVLNPGNHYVNAEKRTADGIEWILRK